MKKSCLMLVKRARAGKRERERGLDRSFRLCKENGRPKWSDLGVLQYTQCVHCTVTNAKCLFQFNGIKKISRCAVLCCGALWWMHIKPQTQATLNILNTLGYKSLALSRSTQTHTGKANTLRADKWKITINTIRQAQSKAKKPKWKRMDGKGVWIA